MCVGQAGGLQLTAVFVLRTLRELHPGHCVLQEPMSDHLSGSTPKGAAIAAATAAAAAVGSSGTDSAAGTPHHTTSDDRTSSGSNRGGAAEPAGPIAAGGGGGQEPRSAATDKTGGTMTSNEYNDLVEDIVSDKPQLSLTDLEAKLDIISPEDLTVSVALTCAGLCVALEGGVQAGLGHAQGYGNSCHTLGWCASGGSVQRLPQKCVCCGQQGSASAQQGLLMCEDQHCASVWADLVACCAVAI